MPDAATVDPTSTEVASYTLRDVPAPRRFSMMRDMMADGHPPFMIARLTATREDREAPFDGGLRMRTTGELSCIDLYTDAATYTRTESGIASSPTGIYSLQLQVEGVSHFTRQGIHCAQPGLGGLVTQYTRSLMKEMDRLSTAEAGAALDNLCRLLALHDNARTKAAAPADRAIQAARLVQVRRHIDQHLPDPALTPASVATAHRMSQRSLHLLFEPTGVTFARHVLRRRLQECHAMLASPAHAYRSVTDIAFAWGFNSLTTFYSAFQRQFGAAPGEVRRAAVGGNVAPGDRPGRVH